MKAFLEKAKRSLWSGSQRVSRTVRKAWSRLKKPLGIVLVLTVTGFAVYYIFIFPPSRIAELHLYEGEAIKLENETRATWAQVFGGAFILITLFIGYHRLKTEQEGQITDRFTRAIDQLGSPKMEIRLGGIYALERISKDSEKDYWTVMEVLSAFVRENAKREEAEEPGHAENEPLIPPDEAPIPAVRADIQAALTVIARRRLKYGSGEDLPLDLRSTALPHVRLDDFDQRVSNLRGVDLSGSDLRKACLTGADLREAILVGADMSGATLSGADLNWAELMRGHFRNATLIRADLRRARLIGADLKESDLRWADLTEADLRSSDLTGAKLTRRQYESAITDEHTILPEEFLEPGNTVEPPP